MFKSTSAEELHRIFMACKQRVCTDTRKAEKGSVFFALKGPNFNANEMAAAALQQGCSYAVIDEEKYAKGENYLLVNDVLQSLQQLAMYHRRLFSIPVLAITGSNGKTTNKELINAVLSQKFNTLATAGNLNNHIGVPLTLLRLTSAHEFAIIEMGANHQGEIDALCRIAEPGYGLITNIGSAHLEGFGGPEGVVKGKTELYRYLKATDGKVFMNGDDPVLSANAGENNKITYGCRKLYDVTGKDYTSGNTVKFKYTTRYGDKNWDSLPLIETSITGRYNFINCLAAVCVGVHFEVAAAQIRKAIGEYVPDMNRSQLVKTAYNTLILDAYNANPDSMKAAIENFARYEGANKLLLLGDMFELGEYSRVEHEKIVELLLQHGLSNAILVGPEFQAVEGPFIKFSSTAECMEHLKNTPPRDSTILIKGSRGMKMETLKEAL